MLVGGFLAARWQGGEGEPALQPGVLAFLVDGGKTGLKKQLINPWRSGIVAVKEEEQPDEEDDSLPTIPGTGEEKEETPAVTPPLSIRHLLIIKDEESLRARRTLMRGTAVIQQTEGAHLVTAGPLNLPERSCQFGGSNRGTCIGPIKTTSAEDEWKLTVKDPIRRRI